MAKFAFQAVQQRYDLTGKTFSDLSVLGCVGRTKHKQPKWLCVCRCGGTAVTTGNKLRSGHTKSCGCYQKKRAAEAQTTHGLCGSPTYETWRSMVSRCTNPNDKSFRWYGAVGVTVCGGWMAFDGFLADMGERPEGHTIERLNYTEGYKKNNCVWIPANRQNTNKSSNVFVEHGGERMCIADWARELNMPYGLIQSRLKRGWTPEEAFSRG